MTKPFTIIALTLAGTAVAIGTAFAQSEETVPAPPAPPAHIKVIGIPETTCDPGPVCADEAEAKRIRAALALMYLGVRRNCGARPCAIRMATRPR